MKKTLFHTLLFQIVVLVIQVAMAAAPTEIPKVSTIGVCRGWLESTLVRGQPKLSIVPTEKPKVLNQIIGEVRIDLSKTDVPDVIVDARLSRATRKKGKEGSALLEILSPHLDPQSPTAGRVEEKAVVTKSNLAYFLQYTQSSEFSHLYNNDRPLKWSLRDSPPPGYTFVTVTEYGEQLFLKSEVAQTTFMVKPRFRKYFKYPIASLGTDLTQYESVLGSVSVFELKISSVDGPDDGTLISQPGEVFKPRIFVTDEMADQIKGLYGLGAKTDETLESIRSGALQLQENAKNPEHVESMIAAIRILLAKDPAFFKPRFVTAYNRSSYKYVHEGREFQFTADEKVRVYKVTADVKTEFMLKHLKDHSLVSLPNDIAFIELKSPPSDKKNKTSVYTGLIQILDQNHIAEYEKGGGKYALARHAEESINVSKLDRTLLDEGTLFWLIKGLSQLDQTMTKRDVLERAYMEVAYPFVVGDGKVFRVVFTYRPLNRLDGKRMNIIDKIQVLDQYGNVLNDRKLFKDVLARAHKSPQAEILAINFEGTVIPFKNTLSSTELIEYQEYLSHYFSNLNNLNGSTRTFARMNKINSAQALRWQKLKYQADNAIQFMIERSKRIAFTAMATGLVLYGYDTIRTNNYIQNSNTTSSIVQVASESNVTTHVLTSDIEKKIPHNDNSVELLTLEGMKTLGRKPISLISLRQGDGTFLFQIPASMRTEFGGDGTIQLLDPTGKMVKFRELVAAGVSPNGVITIQLVN